MDHEEVEIQKDLATGNLEQIYRSAVERLLLEGADERCSKCRLWFSWKSLKNNGMLCPKCHPTAST